MKQINHFYTLLIIIIVIGAIYFLSKLNTKYEDSESDNIVSTPMDSLYINDCKRIIDYKQGVCPLGKKKMILSTAAKNYYKEEYRIDDDGILNVVNVIYLEDYKGYELYWIIQSSPIYFSLNETITDVECMGSYVVLYNIKDQPAITIDIIKKMGFNDKADYFTSQELSWFLLIDPNTAENILVKDALTEQDCERFFDDFIKDKASSITIAKCTTGAA